MDITIPLPDEPNRQPVASFVDVLSIRAQLQPNDTAYTFLADGKTSESSITYRQLDLTAQRIASQLLERARPGDRALLLYPTGREFVEAFFGCMYAGIVSIPMYPPRANRSLHRLETLISDSGALLCMTPASRLADLRQHLGPMLASTGLAIYAPEAAVDELSARGHRNDARPDTLAYLQYTSGSTSVPKGVMVTHRNLVFNCRYMMNAWNLGPRERSVTWLPHFHDMGLIEGLLDPVFGGYPVAVLSPAQFARRPLSWLEAITRFKATHSGGPNFAWDLCVDKIGPDRLEQLDLSSWTCAYNGAEPVRAQTMQRFTEHFAACGFHPDALSGCYGLAESTLMVSGRPRLMPARIEALDTAALEERRVERAAPGAKGRLAVGCGFVTAPTTVLIVDPATCEVCPPDAVGEVWVGGPTRAAGYWMNDQATQETFNAHTTSGDGPFMRTGDLGFFVEGELFLAGRIKDMIIVRGANYYPQDIELVSETAYPGLQQGRVAAFSVEVEGEERLVVAQQVERSLRRAPIDELEKAADAIRSAIAAEFELHAWCIQLIDVNGIHMTSSGKVQRQACKTDFQAGTGPVLFESRKSEPAIAVAATAPDIDVAGLLALGPSARARALVRHLTKIVADVMELDESDVAPDTPLGSLGIDSLRGNELAARLERDLQIEVSTTLIWNYPTVVQISTHLSKQLGAVPDSTPNRYETSLQTGVVSARNQTR